MLDKIKYSLKECSNVQLLTIKRSDYYKLSVDNNGYIILRDHRANQKALDNLDILEKMIDYLLSKLSKDSTIGAGFDDSEHFDIIYKKKTNS